MFRYVLAGLMVIAMAGVASAEHKPGHNPGGGTGEGNFAPVIRDSTGKIVGIFGTNLTVFFNDAFYQIGGFNQSNVGEPNFSWSISGGGELWFTDTQCQASPAYVGPPFSTTNNVYEGVQHTWMAVGTTAIFAADLSAPVETIRVRSRQVWNEANCRSDIDVDKEARPAAFVFDFAEEFLPPLTLAPR